MSLPARDELENRRHLVDYAATIERCACCGINQRQAQRHRWPGLQVHHIVKRSRRLCHLAANLLCLCERCHRLAEGERVRVDGALLPTLSFAHCLWLKREAEPATWRPRLIAALLGRSVRPLKPPAALLRERETWTRKFVA